MYGNFITNSPFALCLLALAVNNMDVWHSLRHEQPTSAYNPKGEWLSLHQQSSSTNSFSNRKLQGPSIHAGILSSLVLCRQP